MFLLFFFLGSEFRRGRGPYTVRPALSKNLHLIFLKKNLEGTIYSLHILELVLVIFNREVRPGPGLVRAGPDAGHAGHAGPDADAVPTRRVSAGGSGGSASEFSFSECTNIEISSSCGPKHL